VILGFELENLTMPNARHSASQGALMEFWSGMIAALPRIKTYFQWVGLLVAVVGFVAYHEVRPELVIGAIATGVVGCAILATALAFRLIEKNKNLQSPWFLLVCMLFISVFGLAFFWLALHYLAPSSVPKPSPTGVRADPPPPLPDDIDFVDADFVGKENSDIRGTLLDFRFTNQGYRSAFVKQLVLDVKQVWHLKEPLAQTQAVIGPSATYEVKLEEEKVPYEAKVRVSNSVEPGKSDEFHLMVKDMKQWSGVYTIYRFNPVLISNGTDHRTPYKKDFLVFFSEHTNSFPSFDEVLAGNYQAKMTSEEAKSLLDENRETLREIGELENCLMSPALIKFIQSAGTTK
jgi:hypothetical protein